MQVRLMELKAEQEKSRVLEDALRVLAKEHHELERSMTYSSRVCSPRFYDTDNDEFYDAFAGGRKFRFIFIVTRYILVPSFCRW